MQKKLIHLLSLLPVLMLLMGSAYADTVTTNVIEISKHGNMDLDITGADLFDRGFEYGDILEVTILDQSWEMPFVSAYSDVDTGLPVVRAEDGNDTVVLAINMGDFAASAGIAEKSEISEEPGYRWEYLVETPVQVSIAMKQEDGYREQWLIRQLVRTNQREDYPHLSDAEFANFRRIDTTGMRENTLYRSSSPVNPDIGRSAYADKAAEEAGIATVINLADASNTYEGTENAHYQTCRVIYLNLGMDFTSDSFKSSLAEGMRFIIDNPPPYLLHCNEGKDRAGFVSALLECLMGATIREVVDDYMQSYIQYYGVEPGSEKYEAVVSSNIVSILNEAFGVEDIYQADLSSEAEAFLLDELGLSEEEVSALRKRLGTDS